MPSILFFVNQRTTLILQISLFCVALLWGGYSTLTYVGLPVHQLVMLDEGSRNSITAACDGAGTLCQGLHALLPSIMHTLGRAAPYLWYGILSVALFIVLLGIEWSRSGVARFRLRFSAFKLLLLFVASLWLLFTIISTGSNGDQPYRQIYQPSSAVYPKATQETLNALTNDYDTLKARGCLEVLGVLEGSGNEVSTMSYLCMQESFVTRVLSQLVMILLYLLTFLTLGRMVLRLLRIHARTPLLECVFSVGLGACGLIALLWLLALVGLYTQAAGWILLLLILGVGYKHLIHWLRALFDACWTYDGAWYGAALVLGWLLVTYLAFNFLTVIRPFPIGWDDLGVYLNQPRLLVSYGTAIPTLGTFKWEFLTSLGFLLFGYGQPFGATNALMINWTEGLLATLSVYAFGRTFLGPRAGILSALLYYTLPLVGHFSYADMKVDNAVFTMGALCMLVLFQGLFPTEEEEGARTLTYREAMLAGIFGGFGLSMKVTVVMVIAAMGTMLVGALLHWTGYIGALALAAVVFMKQGTLGISAIAARVYGNPDALPVMLIFSAFLILGIVAVALAIRLRPLHLRHMMIVIGIFIGSMLLTIAPWVMTNNLEYGTLFPHLRFSPPNRYTPSFVTSGETFVGDGQDVRTLPKELQINPKHPACTSTSKVEELDRYWGTGDGWSHYLTLPWRTVMNSDSFGYYVTLVPALLLFPILLLLPFFWSKEGRWLRWLFASTVFLIVQWIFFANGVPWYGIGMFLGLSVGLEAFVARAPDHANRTLAAMMIALSLIVAYANRFWQSEQQRNLFTYPLGVVSAEAMLERTVSHYNTVRALVMERFQSDRPYTYRIGTFIPYFIPRNLEVLPLGDHQLNFFTCLNQEKNPQLTLKRLQALGFNSIIFDTNTDTIEKDQNGTLHKKVKEFRDFAETPNLGLQAPINDADSGIVYILLP